MVVMYLLRADTSPRWKIRCIQHVATRQSMQEGVLLDAREQVSLRPGRPAASVRDTPGVRTAPWSPQRHNRLGFGSSFFSPAVNKSVCCACGLLPLGVAFLAPVLYLVFSVMEQ